MENNKTVNVPHYTEAISNLNNLIHLKKSAGEIAVSVETAQQALKVENMRRVDVRVEELLKLYQESPVEFWTEYLNHATVEVLRLNAVEDDKDGLRYVAAPANKYLSFGRLESAWRKLDDSNVTLARVPNTYRMIAYFTDNLTRAACHAMGVKERKVTVPVFNWDPKKDLTPTDRKTLDFSKVDAKSMAYQLDAIVKNLLPENFVAPMRKSDLRIIQEHHFNNRARASRANSEADTIANILEVVRLRLNDEALTVKSGAKVHAVKTEDSAKQH